MAGLMGGQQTAVGSGQWSNNDFSYAADGSGGTTSRNSAMPTQYAQSQAKLGDAQASAVHDPLIASQGVDANKMSRFNQVYGLLSGEMGHLNNNFATAGGSNGTPPPISSGPVLNSQQIQQQVNQSRSANDQQTQGAQQRSDASLAGRGFGSGSPLSQALNSASQGQNMATNTSNETNTRLNAAQQNAGQMLNSQQALSNQWATGNQLDIQRRAPIFGQQNALISALSGLV